MRVTVRQLRKIIREALSQKYSDEATPIEVDHPSDVEAEEDAWAGGDNLTMPIKRIKEGIRRLRQR